MIISVPRYLIIGLAGIFSAYHLILATVSIVVPRAKGPYIAAMVLYAVATIASLWLSRSPRMPIWLAAFNAVVALVVPLLVTSQVSTVPSDSYAAWYTAAIGTLMVITSTRRRHTFAWIGIGALIVQTIAWAGPGGLVAYGVVGDVLWVGVSHALSMSLAKAGRDTRQYALAEREAVEWRAAQEAHVSERQFRLGQTSRMSLPMLRQIVAVGAELTEGQRLECLYLEGAIRDEIRGRKLLNNRVREQIMVARRKGTTVTLLDEGGLDDLDDGDLERVLNRLAEAIRDTQTDKLIARTVPEGSDIAITVVGLSSLDGGHASALGSHNVDDEEDQVDLWLEIPRTAD
ncbi:MAG: putative rane protein [Frondihabitans sp.]|nr:putative rane protein [Frondihabitans sp.]